MGPAPAGQFVAGGSCYGFDVLGFKGIPGWFHEDSVFPQPLAVVHCFHLVSSALQDSSGSVAQSSLTPALSSRSLYRMRSEALLANLRES